MSAPEPYWSDGEDVRLFLGDCLEVMAGMEPGSVDAVCTDPPYGLEFMGVAWDTFSDRPKGSARARNEWGDFGSREHARHPSEVAGIQRRKNLAYYEFSLAWAAEAQRVLKPGGHLLAFSGSRTYHRMACAIEDVGFEIRDSIDWIYASGFPKGLDVSKAIDKAAGADRLIIGASPFAARKPHGTWTGDVYGDDPGAGDGPKRTAPATPQAAEWEGWGTALKPAHEPIVCARKPLAGTVEQNVRRYGTGALNIGACRVDGGSRPARSNAESASGLTGTGGAATYGSFAVRGSIAVGETAEGRWPANVVFSHSAGCEQAGTAVIPGNIRHNPTVVAARANIAKGAEGERRRGVRGHGNADGTGTVVTWVCQPGCPVAELDRQSGVLTSGANPERRGSDKFRDAYGEFPGQPDCVPHRGADSGGASRFFPVFKYEAKAPASERPRLPDGTAWPTVKPLDLMRFLCRLVTRPGGLILDPFCGTGTTASAALIEGFRCVLIERDPVAAELAKVRLAKPVQPVIFGGDL